MRWEKEHLALKYWKLPPLPPTSWLLLITCDFLRGLREVSKEDLEGTLFNPPSSQYKFAVIPVCSTATTFCAPRG